MSKSLFFITIGPVNASIGNSRKMRDMYAGSFLLSYLISKAIEKLKTESIEIIIPVTQTDKVNRGLNFPNKIIAKVENYNDDEKSKLGKDIAEFIQKEFKNICKKVFNEANVELQKEASAQLERYIEIYWLFEDCDDNYIAAYKSLVSKMRSIKNLRQFKQINEPAGRKCSLYHDSNVLFYKEKANGETPKYLCYNTASNVSGKDKCKYSLKPGEGLSAFAFVKRMLDKMENKPTGYSLDINSVAYMLLKSRLKSRIDNWGDLRDEACEAVLDLYNSLEPTEKEYPKDQIELAKEIFKKIEKDKIKITSYYAIVKLDGDNMGDAYNECVDFHEQQELSKRTSEFAYKAQGIAADNKGICIFAGGEDILMFLPVDTLFLAISELYEQYRSIIENDLTFSAGIVVAHFMQPLKDVMSRVYEAEKKAKNHCEEKNSFSIDLIKRSGESVCMVNSFGDNCVNFNTFSDVVKKLYNNDLSHSFLYNLTSVLEKIVVVVDNEEKNHDDEMIKALIAQAVKAKVKDENDGVLETVTSLYEKFDKLSSFINSLKVIDFLSKEGEYGS